MFKDFESFDTSVDVNVTIHGVRSGNGPPLLLLHGFPETHHMWHIVAPQLTNDFTVIALDLRGYGASSKPRGSSSHIEYAKSTMAHDCVTVMGKLGFRNFYICSHDRGARVAHKLCVDYPHAVEKVIFLDICPSLAMYNITNQAFATAYWHWFFLVQPSPFPEELIAASPKLFADKAFGGELSGKGVGAFDKQAVEIYVRQLGDKEALHGMCEDYRAGATIDLEQQKSDIEKGRKVKCPVRVLWGKKAVVEKMFDAIQEWKAVSEGAVDGESVDCGHFIPEEKPDVVVQHIKEFLI